MADARPPGPTERWKRRRPPPFTPGRHALVHHEPARLQGLDAVPLTDESGTKMLLALADGQEVEMLAWRLVWRQGPSMLYHVCCLHDGTRGWVRAEFLRPSQGPTQTARSAAEPRTPRVRSEQRPRSHVAAGRPHAPDVVPQARAAGVGLARDDRPVACTVCGTEVHPYNLWTNAKGEGTGCYSCHGRRP